MTEERSYLDGLTTYTSAKYSYDDNYAPRKHKFDGAYLTRKWTEGVKDADGALIAPKVGNPASTVDENYT